MNNPSHAGHRLPIFIIAFFAFFAFVGCAGETTLPETFTVSFETAGGSAIPSIEVEKGRKITSGFVADPVKDDGSAFVGWFKDDVTFADPWDFAVDIVTADVTLYAKWIKSEPYPTEVALTADPFSNTLSWIQTGIDADTDFTVTFFLGTLATRQETSVDSDGAPITVTVEYYVFAETGTVVPGSHETSGENGVLWAPDASVPGGVYKVTIVTDGENETAVENVYFKGEGTEENPYLLYESADLAAIATVDGAGSGRYYRVAHAFTHEVAFAEIDGRTFEGTLDGAGFTISVNGNAGMFYALGEDAFIHDLTIAGTITSASVPTLGGLAIENSGFIRDCTSRVAITSSAGVVGDPDTMLLGGAGGFVGINRATGRIETSTFVGDSSSNGVIKALIGGGGIASVNYGTIERCVNRGTLGAYNSVESGKSMSNYSYMGGIAGFNFGQIRQSATTSTGKLLAQRYWNNGLPEDTANNRVVGGIAGYNAEGAEISESYFNGIRVHGDEYVGGIAGINAGLISACYAGGRYYATPQTRSYVAGRTGVGGIAGLLEATGEIVGCYSAVNVYAFDGTPYAIASRAVDSVYVSVNHDSRATGEQLYGNVPTDTLVAPTGTGNLAIANAPLVFGDGVSYLLPAVALDILGDAFIASEGDVVLAWQTE